MMIAGKYYAWVTVTEWEGLKTYWVPTNPPYNWMSLTNWSTERDIKAGTLVLRPFADLTADQKRTLLTEDSKIHHMTYGGVSQ